MTWLHLDGLELQLRGGSPLSVDDDRNAINLVVYSDDLTTDLGRLHGAGVETLERANCHHFRDPDGYWWQLVDPAVDHSGA